MYNKVIFHGNVPNFRERSHENRENIEGVKRNGIV